MARIHYSTESDHNGEHPLGMRERLLLRVLIERFIRDGEPVGSKNLAKESGLRVSSATVRNILARLEELGYLNSPHSSAGRMPTARGYRFFVDHLMLQPTLPSAEITQLWSQVDRSLSAQAMVESTSRLLANLTNLAGVVTLPRFNHVNLRRIEFLPLSDRRVLVILVLHEREVQQRVIQVKREYSAAELQQAANYLNLHFAGGSLHHIRNQLLMTMAHDRAAMDQLMETVLEVASKTFTDADEESDCLVMGEANLLSSEHLISLERARELFDAFHHKQDILHLLDRSLHAEGVRLFIGAESGLHSLQGCSVITAPYRHQGEQAGVLGIIGPLRMAYQQVIPIVSAAAQLLSASLNR